MKTLTEKQAAFVANKVAGLTNEAAAIAAGYSPRGAAQAATGLMKHPDVKAALAAAKRKAKAQAAQVQAANKVAQAIADSDNEQEDENAPVLREAYDSPLDFMLHCMNNPRLTFGPRFEAAKQAMPYVHAKPGEKGKKESRLERAKAHTQGEPEPAAKSRASFTPLAAPGRTQ